MKLTITINMDNAAFEDRNEIARILSDLAERMEAVGQLKPGGSGITLRDINGNTVGKAKVTR